MIKSVVLRTAITAMTFLNIITAYPWPQDQTNPGGDPCAQYHAQCTGGTNLGTVGVSSGIGSLPVPVVNEVPDLHCQTLAQACHAQAPDPDVPSHVPGTSGGAPPPPAVGGPPPPDRPPNVPIVNDVLQGSPGSSGGVPAPPSAPGPGPGPQPPSRPNVPVVDDVLASGVPGSGNNRPHS